MKKLKKLTAIMTATVMMFTLAVPVLADTFVSSVTTKGAPEIVPVTNKDGEEVKSIIYDETGNEIGYAIGDQLILIPYAQRTEADSRISEELEEAYSQAKNEKISELSPDVSTYIKKSGVKEENLVISDLFDLYMIDDLGTLLKKEGNYTKITFKTNLTKDDFLMVLINPDLANGGLWQVISADRIVFNDDGTVTILFDELGPILFVIEKDYITPSSDSPSSPQTSDDTYLYMTLIILLMSAGIFATAEFSRRRDR